MSLLLHPQLAGCRRIFIEDITIEASIGFHDFELAQRQRIFVGIEVFIQEQQSTSARDNVADVLNYDDLREGIVQIAQRQHFNLQETLIDEILGFCLGFSSVVLAIARTQKPDVYPDCKTVGIESLRWRATPPAAAQ